MPTENEKKIIVNALENANNALKKLDRKSLEEYMYKESGIEMCLDEFIETFDHLLDACIETLKVS